MPTWVDDLEKLTPTIITLILGIGASYIAYQQHKINKDKFRLDLFNRRLEAFEKLQEFLIAVMRDGRVKDESLQTLAAARYKSRFLFGGEIEDYFDELWKKAVDARALYSRIYTETGIAIDCADRNEVCDQESALMKWFFDQMKDSQEQYDPYLRFDR